MARQAEEQVRIGSRFNTGLLLEQAAVSEKQARKAAGELGARFPAERIERIKTLRQEIQTIGADRAVADGKKKLLTDTQNYTLLDAKDWVRDLRDAAANAFDGDEKKLDAYTTGPKVGQSVPRLLSLMETLVAQASKDAAALAAEGFTAQDISRGRQLLESLREVDAVQEKTIKELPVKTKELYAKKGELFLLLKQLVRAARRTWRSDPVRSDAFRLNLLGRGGKRPAKQ